MSPSPESAQHKSKMQDVICQTNSESSQTANHIPEFGRRDSAQSDVSINTRISGTSQVSKKLGHVPPEPPDGGYGWMVVIGAIIAGALVPSLFMCFGVFMNAFIEVFPETSKSSAAWIPSIMSSLMNCMGPLTSALVNLYSARLVTLVGGCILSVGLIASYFTSSVEALYLTYGVLGGIGAGLCIAPGLYLISAYFKNRRGLATGVCMAGSSLGQVVAPYLIQFLLEEFSYRGCILILGGLTLNICVSAALYRPLQTVPKPAKKPKNRLRSVSQTSYKSSLSFIPDEGICMTKNGNYVVMAKKNANCQKKKKRKKSKNNNNNRKKNNQKSATKTEIQAILLENTWNNIKQNDSLAPTRSRSRTLSLDSSRILPGIPEEHDEDVENDASQTEEDDNFTEDLDGHEDIPMSNNSDSTDFPKINNNTTSKTNDNESCHLLHACNNGSANVESIPIVNNNVPCESNNINDRNHDPNVTNIDLINNECLHVSNVSSDSTNGSTDMCKNKEERSYDSVSDVSVTLSLPDSDDDMPNGQNESGHPVLEVVSLHHCYGSVTSIASLSPFEEEKTQTSILANISKFLGFDYFKESIFYIIAASFTFLIVVLTSYTMYIPTYGISIQLSKDQSAGLISIYALASMGGRIFLPTLSDYVKIKRKHIYLASCILVTGSIVLTIFSKSYEVLVVALVLFGFSTGGSIALSISVCLDYIAVEKFAALFGLVQLVTGVVVLFANPLFGLLLDATKTYTLTFSILSVAGLLSGLILYLDRFSNYENLAPPKKPNKQITKL